MREVSTITKSRQGSDSMQPFKRPTEDATSYVAMSSEKHTVFVII
jgi:hypothetical protein